MASLPGVPAEIDNINELWDLVHQKDEDLRHAAELGKMVLDEKEAEAEAHEAEKNALWRRIKDMATRVEELEQESAEARCLCQDQDACVAGEGNNLFGFASPERISPRSSSSGAEDAKLRARNDVLERKVDTMREQLEETKLELSAARKAQLYYKKASLQSCGGSSRSPSPTSSPNKLLEHGSAPSSSDGAPGGMVTLPRVGGTLMPPRTAGVSMKGLLHARPTAEDNGHGVDSVSPEDKEDLKGFEDEIEDPQRKDTANDLDASRLLEQNASLMAELDSKNELIEALRQQLKQLQYMTQQRGTRGRCTFSPRHAIEELGEAGSDDDCGDENENPDFGVRERSFMDDLRDEAGGNPVFVMPSPSIDVPGTDDGENLKKKPWGPGRIEPVAPERRRSFGGVVQENIPLVLSSRKNGKDETGKIADWDRKRGHQGKIPPKAGREKSPFRGKKHSSSSPPRRRRRSLDRARGRGPSPVASSRHEAAGITGDVGQSLTVAAASPLDPVMAGALETWPASPHGVPLSWSSAMRALAAVARVGRQQQQLGGSEMEMAESDVTVGRQEVPISRESVKKENVATTKNEAEKVQALVTVRENSPTSAFPSAGGDASISPESVRLKETKIREREVEDVRSPPTSSEQSAKLEATEKTAVDAQATASENQLSSAEAVEGDEFTISKKQSSTSPEIIVKREAAVIEIVEGGQAIDVEKDMAPSKKGGELALEEAREVQEPAVGGDTCFSANSQEPTSLEAGKPKVVVKEEVEGSQSSPAGEGDEFLLAEELTSPVAMKEGMGLPVPAMGDGKFPAVDGLESTCPDSMKPEAAIAKLEDAQQVPAVGNEIPSSAFQQESTSQASVMTEAVKGGKEIEDVKALTVKDKGFPFSAQGRAPASPTPVMEKVSNDQEPYVEGREFSAAKVEGSVSQASVKTQSAIEEREIVGIKVPAVTVRGLHTEDQLFLVSPASVKLEGKVGGIQRPVAKGQEKPARPSGTEKAQPLPTAIAGAHDMTRNRVERKSRQALAKLGLRAVSGVFCVTMKASNGDLLIVEKPDVFKHPQQSTYVIFGEADWEKSGSGGGSHHPTARRAGAEAFLRPAPAKCGPRGVEVSKNPSDADRATVDDRSASTEIDPADVLTVMFHTGCVSDAAIEALREVGGDVVNAVMYLTEA